MSEQLFSLMTLLVFLNGPGMEANVFRALAQDSYHRKATNSVTNVFPATLTISYDGNGNLTNDGTRRFEFDAENRMTNFFASGKWRTELKYDGFSRRRVRKEYKWSGTTWVQTNEVRYIYDGMLVLQERDSNNVPKVTYTRGSDLSGSFQGAGGIGGMLGITLHGTQATNYTHYFYKADGNGNITTVIDTNQTVVANYAYEPFGSLWTQSGSFTNSNRYRFSSKEWHPQSGLILYEGRAYEPTFGRWLSQDTIGELGGINLHRFLENDPLNWVDPWGFDEFGYVSQYGYTLRRFTVYPDNFIGPLPLNASTDSFNRMRLEMEGDGLETSLFGELLLPGGGLFASGGKGFRVCAAKGVLNPKIYTQLEKQLAKDGPASVQKALQSATEALAEHEAKLQQILKDGGHPSQVEGTIRNVKNQIETLKQFITNKGL